MAWHGRLQGLGLGSWDRRKAWRKGKEEERGRGSTLRTGWMTSTALRTEKKRTVDRGYQCGAAAPGHPDFKERGTLKWRLELSESLTMVEAGVEAAQLQLPSN